MDTHLSSSASLSSIGSFDQNLSDHVSEDEFEINRAPHDREHPYVQVSRELIRDSSLSFGAMALLIYLLSFPPDWKIIQSYIVKDRNIGKDALRSLIRELMGANYLRRVMGPRSKGRFPRYRYWISESRFPPQTQKKMTVEEIPPRLDSNKNNHGGLAAAVNPPLLNKDRRKKEGETSPSLVHSDENKFSSSFTHSAPPSHNKKFMSNDDDDEFFKRMKDMDTIFTQAAQELRRRGASAKDLEDLKTFYEGKKTMVRAGRNPAGFLISSFEKGFVRDFCVRKERGHTPPTPLAEPGEFKELKKLVDDVAEVRKGNRAMVERVNPKVEGDEKFVPSESDLKNPDLMAIFLSWLKNRNEEKAVKELRGY